MLRRAVFEGLLIFGNSFSAPVLERVPIRLRFLRHAAGQVGIGASQNAGSDLTGQQPRFLLAGRLLIPGQRLLKVRGFLLLETEGHAPIDIGLVPMTDLQRLARSARGQCLPTLQAGDGVPGQGQGVVAIGFQEIIGPAEQKGGSLAQGVGIFSAQAVEHRFHSLTDLCVRGEFAQPVAGPGHQPGVLLGFHEPDQGIGGTGVFQALQCIECLKAYRAGRIL